MKLNKIKGFYAYMMVVFANSFVDLGHKILIQDTLYQTTNGSTFTILSAIINAFILLPYLLLFTPSGFISDKYSKTKVLQITAASAIPLTILITWCYFQGYFWGAFMMTLLLGTQSAINSPAKYGYIKELFGKELLAKANAYVQTLAIISILSGTFLFTLFFSHYLAKAGLSESTDKASLLQGFAPLGFILIAVSIVETVMTYRLPVYEAVDPDSSYDFSNYYKGAYARTYLKMASKKSVIITCIIGLSLFWAVNQVLLACYGAYAKDYIDNISLVFVQSSLAIAGIGLLLGANYAGRISRGFIETGIVPFASFGLALGLFILPHLTHKLAILSLFLVYGFFGGMLIVPLNALIQFNAGKSELGKILSANNFIQNIFMLGFLILTVITTSLGMNSSYLLYSLFGICFLSTIATFIMLPQAFSRYLLYLITSRFYKLSVGGLEHLPSQGGVLLLGNHTSFIDWAIIQIASPRPIRFVMEKAIYEKWYFKWVLQQFGVIPISRGNSQKALTEINNALNRGEVVALFPEGRLSINGQLGKFHSGFERAAVDANAVIVPFYLLGLWGSRMSYASGHYKKINRISGRQVSVSFGQPLDINSTANLVRQKVKELSISSWKTYVNVYGSIQEAWLEQAKHEPKSIALIDPMAGEISQLKLMGSVLFFSRAFKKRLASAKTIGLLLPPGVGGVIANLSVLCLGKIIVNLNYTVGEELLKSAVKKAGIQQIITSRTFVHQLEKKGFNLSEALSELDLIYLEDYKNKKTKVAIGRNMLLCKLLPQWLLRLVLIKKVDIDDTAAILFSSGSENEPKGIELTHGNILSNIKQIASVMSLKDDDVVLSSLPLFHAFGLTATTLMPLLQGITMVSFPDPTNAITISKLIYRHNVTLMCSTATFLNLYTRSKHINPALFQSLRLVIAGAEKLQPAVRTAFLQKFHCEVYEGYGATEVSPVASCNLPDAISPADLHVHQANKPGSVGLPLPGCAFRIIDPETGVELERGEEGMVLIGGSQVMKGYLNDEEKTAQVLIKEGDINWYVTGDKGKLDSDGFLTLVDRYSRFVKTGGEMISLSHVEQSITQLLGERIDDLMAIALPHVQKGEVIALLYQGQLDRDELKTILLQSELSRLMIPKIIIKLDDLPRLGTGKKDYKAAKTFLLDQETLAEKDEALTGA